ncbi:MAG: cytochrome c oxidase subunit I [Ardenticatenaceae bacterium]|nr:cytochrome c oxidase subunit I [Ardenticatenaceae bacterium]
MSISPPQQSPSTATAPITKEIIPPDVKTARSEEPNPQITSALKAQWADPEPGIIGTLKAIQNDAVGGRIMVTAFIFFLLAGVVALLMRMQLITPENDLFEPNTYNGFFTVHGSTMMYLFAVPMIEGMAIVMLPFLLGNREMPFPRLGVFSYFTFVLGGILFFSSYFLQSVPDAGWFAYAPLSGPEYSPGIALDYWLLALGVAEVAAIAAGIEIIIAILRMRAPGMSLGRMPLFAWAMLVTAFSILFAFTPLIVASLLLELDRKIGTHFFNPTMGGSALLWQHLFWIFGHPEVYIQFLPATGMMAMIIPVFSRRRIIGYPLVVVSMVATGFMSFLLWVHHMFSVGLPQVIVGIFSAASILIAIPTGVQIFAYVATILFGRPQWKTSFLFAVGFLVTFVLGGITGVMVGVAPFDWQVHDSYFVVAHLHYVLIGGVVFPIFAALYYWMPKFTGKLLSERLGKWNFWLMFIGFHVTFFPQHISGLLGMPRRVYTYPPGMGWDVFNLISTVGAFVLAAGVLVFLVNFVISVRNGAKADCNPWGADSLEWSLESPPANYGFSVLPIVHGRHPLWDQQTLAEGSEQVRKVVRGLAEWPLSWRAALITSVTDAQPEEIFRVSGPSFWPVVCAVGLVTVFGSEIFSLRPVALLGIIVLVIGVVGWNWPEPNPSSRAEEEAFEKAYNIPVRTFGSRIVARSAMWLWLLLQGIALASFSFSYFFLQVESDVWPQGGLAAPPVMRVGVALLLLLVNAVALRRAAQQIRQNRLRPVLVMLVVGFPLQVAALGLLVFDLWQLPFDWATNAYGSAFFGLAGYMVLMLVIGLGTSLFALYGTWRGFYSPDRSATVENTAVYWQIMVVYWLVMMGILYGSPYLGA